MNFEMGLLLQELVTYLEENTITPEVRADLIADCIYKTISDLDINVKQLKRL